MNKTDYTEQLRESAKTKRWMTAERVPPVDMNRLTHQLRYQAAGLALDITIRTDPERRTVSFLCSEKGKRADGTPVRPH